jgi:hypothetical protein
MESVRRDKLYTHLLLNSRAIVARNNVLPQAASITGRVPNFLARFTPKRNVSCSNLHRWDTFTSNYITVFAVGTIKSEYKAATRLTS